MTKEIKLARGEIAIIDDDDFGMISARKWYLAGGYAVCKPIAVGKTYLMHSVIMDTPIGMETDHINGNRLDNRKSNLRICTTRENQGNSKIRKDNTSGYKGVSFNKGKYVAFIKVFGIKKYLGRFEKAEDAAEAYASASKKVFGIFGRTK